MNTHSVNRTKRDARGRGAVAWRALLGSWFAIVLVAGCIVAGAPAAISPQDALFDSLEDAAAAQVADISADQASESPEANDAPDAQFETPDSTTTDTSADPDSTSPAASEAEGTVYQSGVMLISVDAADDPQTVLDNLVGADAVFEQASVTMPVAGLAQVALPESLTVEQAIQLVQDTPSVSSAQPDYFYKVADDGLDSQAVADYMAGIVADGFFDDAIVDAIDDTEEDSALQTQAVSDASYPNDTLYSSQWSMKTSAYGGVNAKSAWEYVDTNAAASTASNPIVVAVLDQGFKVDHPDFVRTDGESAIVEPFISTREIGVSTSDVSDFEGHGTHVAGIIGAATNNAIGVAGVTNNTCKIMPVKVAYKNYYMYNGTMYKPGDMTTVTLAVAYAHLVEVKTRASNPLNVCIANLSLGLDSNGPGYVGGADISLYNAIENARRNGIVTVAAACNVGDNNIPPFYAYPSDFDNVVSVINLDRNISATDKVKRAESSNYNVAGEMSKDISAPGNIILSTVPYDEESSQTEIYDASGYDYASGTSMASPLVAGILGLMYTVNPDLSPDEAMSKLYSTARDLRYGSGMATGWDAATGYGEVDAVRAASADEPYISGDSTGITGGLSAFVGVTEPVYTVKKSGVVQSGYTWSTSNTAVATINASTGRLTPVAPGELIVRATNGSSTVQQTVTVYGIAGPSSVAAGSSATYYVGPCSMENWIWSVSDTRYASVTSRTTTPITFNTSSLSPGQSVTVTITAKSYAKSTPSVPSRTLTKQVTIYYQAPYVPPTPTVDPTPTTEPMYRMYNKWSGEHLFTSDASELAKNVKLGWKNEGVAWNAPTSGTAVYRLYNKYSGDHHFTTDYSEYRNCIKAGWKGEGVAFYSGGSKPVYRLYNKYVLAFYHHYTMDSSERAKCIKNGWKSEGIGWYGY